MENWLERLSGENRQYKKMKKSSKTKRNEISLFVNCQILLPTLPLLCALYACPAIVAWTIHFAWNHQHCQLNKWAHWMVCKLEIQFFSLFLTCIFRCQIDSVGLQPRIGYKQRSGRGGKRHNVNRARWIVRHATAQHANFGTLVLVHNAQCTINTGITVFHNGYKQRKITQCNQQLRIIQYLGLSLRLDLVFGFSTTLFDVDCASIIGITTANDFNEH